jgi:serine/threonine-protein phosphatase 6 regulatory ankyrin repeat subunit B
VSKGKKDGAGGAGGGGAGGDSVEVVDPYALIKVCHREGSGDVGEARDLIARGINIDEQDGGQFTALMYAAVWNRIEIVKELVRVGAALDMQNVDGETALMCAARMNRIEIVKELVRAGAALDVQDKQGKTALQFAQEKGLTEIVAILEEAAREGGGAGGCARGRPMAGGARGAEEPVGVRWGSSTRRRCSSCATVTGPLTWARRGT